MAYRTFDGLSSGSGTENSLILEMNGQTTVDLPDASFVRDATLTRDGMDLVLEGPDGTIVIHNYFSADPAPNLVAPDGSTLSANLVESFARSPAQFAQNNSMTDESPVGAVQEVSGKATITRADGTVDDVTIGTPVFQGDIVETDSEGAVNIVFVDETSFAISEDARLSIDEYVFDPATNAGTTNFSMLKGVFVFTSGLIGREDPDDVEIETPVGSIGIRGTIIAGDVDNGEITVVEGAIVLRDFSGNEMTLANRFETAKFDTQNGHIENMGQMSAEDVGTKFASVSGVSPDLFSSINDAVGEQGDTDQGESGQGEQLGTNEVNPDQPPEEQSPAGSEEPIQTMEPKPLPESEPLPEGEMLMENSEPPPEGETLQEGDPLLVNEPTGDPIQDSGETLTEEPPPPPPPSGETSSGFEDSTSGFETTNTTEDSKLTTTETSTATSGSNTEPPPPPPPENTNTTDGTTSGDTTYTPPPPTEEPVFGIQFQSSPVTEEVASLTLATIKGVNGTIGSVSDIQLDYPFYQHMVVVAGANPGEFDIQLESGEELNYDFLKQSGLLNASDQLTIKMHVTNTDGNTIATGARVTVLAVDETPDHFYNAPSESFNGAEGQVWSYHFDKEFHDEDFGDTLTFEMDATTITMLNGLVADGAAGNVDILASGQGAGIIGAGTHAGNGWSFDPTNGHLQLYFASSLEITDGTGYGFNINIRAYDSASNDSGYQSYGFNAYKPTVGYSNTGGTIDATVSKVITGTAGNDSITLGLSTASNNNTIFMDGGNDMLTIVQGTGNTVFLGDGDNMASISASGTNIQNTIIGGFNKDTFSILNAENKFFGMDGDDDFSIDINSSLVMTALQSVSDPDIQIDGGHSDFRAGIALKANDPFYEGFASPGGRGDSLVLSNTGAGTLDFTLIDDNYIRGIERIDAKTNGVADTITLDYNDIFAMTEDTQTLIINLDGSDNLTLTNMGSDLHHTGQVSINDARQGAASDVKTYDVYTDGDITLLIHDDGGAASVTGLPV